MINKGRVPMGKPIKKPMEKPMEKKLPIKKKIPIKKPATDGSQRRIDPATLVCRGGRLWVVEIAYIGEWLPTTWTAETKDMAQSIIKTLKGVALFTRIKFRVKEYTSR